MEILIVCVHYHNTLELLQYIGELEKQRGLVQVAVAHNSEDAKEWLSLSEALKDKKQVFLYDAKANLGYIRGAQFALQEFLKTHELPEWVVISNTDISYQSDAFYENLLNWYPNGFPGIIAPSLYSKALKNYQNPLLLSRYSPFKLRSLMTVYKYDAVQVIFDKLNTIKNRFVKHKCTERDSGAIYAPHGALLLINKRYFESGGDLNYGSFLFGEELYIAETAKAQGLTVYYDNRLKAVHSEHSTVSKEKRKVLNRFFYDSYRYVLTKFYSE